MRSGKLKKTGILPYVGLDCSFALARHLEPEGCHMQLDEPFPLEAIHPRVRRVLLNEFQGRWPTVQEVTQISDRQWLATPGVGPTVLEKIQSNLSLQRRQYDNSYPQLTDAELLDRLDTLQKEFQYIQHALEAKIGETSRKASRAKTLWLVDPHDELRD
jgi:hypothetical protein